MAELKKQGWFNLEGRPGDRTVDQQMKGLDYIICYARDSTILDLGCAEGLVAMEFAKLGAEHVHGVEIVRSHVEMAKSLATCLPCTFEAADCNDYDPKGRYQHVLALAILHKLWEPDLALRRFAPAAGDMFVIRTPPGFGHKIVDARSNFRPYDLDAIMAECGFSLVHETTGTFDELVLTYARNK